MNSFSSKWLQHANTHTLRTDKTDNRTVVSNVSSIPRGISEKTVLEPVKETLTNHLFEFLSPRLEIVPQGYCTNEMTYWANEQQIYIHFRAWVKEKKISYPSLDSFRKCMDRLFPQPYAQFFPERGEWWGFRFHSCPIQESEIKIRRIEKCQK